VRCAVVAKAVELLEVDASLLGDDDPFDALGVDSLALVEYALALEDVFDVEIPEEEVAELVTVGDLVDALVAKTSAGLDV
jgi:acyl carrier protein